MISVGILEMEGCSVGVAEKPRATSSHLANMRRWLPENRVYLEGKQRCGKNKTNFW